MSEEQQIKNLESKINLHKNLLINSSEEKLLEEFYTVLSLNDIYLTITNKNLFNIRRDLEKMDDGILIRLTNEINANNDLVVQEKLKVKKDIITNGNFLFDSLITLNEYYKKLRNDVGLGDCNYKEYYIHDCITKIPERKIEREEIDEVVNLFLKNNYKEYQDVYNIMNEEGRIFLNKNMPGIIGNCMCSCNYNYDSIEDYIIVGTHKNDLIKICSIIHELLHAIEIIKLRENVSREEFKKFRHTSQYQEIKPFTYQGIAYDFLEEIGYPHDEIQKIRTKEMLKNKIFLNSMANIAYDFDNSTDYLDKSNSTLEHTLGFLTSMYLLYDENNFKRNIDIYNKEKLNSKGFELFDKMGIDNNKIEKSLNKQLIKCIK